MKVYIVIAIVFDMQKNCDASRRRVVSKLRIALKFLSKREIKLLCFIDYNHLDFIQAACIFIKLVYLQKQEITKDKIIIIKPKTTKCANLI